MKINFFFLFVSIFLSLLAFTHAQEETTPMMLEKTK